MIVVCCVSVVVCCLFVVVCCLLIGGCCLLVVAFVVNVVCSLFVRYRVMCNVLFVYLLCVEC